MRATKNRLLSVSVAGLLGVPLSLPLTFGTAMAGEHVAVSTEAPGSLSGG
jgi:hypothetical protein